MIWRVFGCVGRAAILLAATPGLPAFAGGIQAEISAVVDSEPFRQAHWGLLIVDAATGSTLCERDAEKLFAPASATKLFTVAAALDAFGPNHRFETPVYARGDLRPDGELAGDLVLVAAGDLTLGGRTTPAGEIAFANSDHTYANGGDKGELTGPDPLAGLNDLARQVVAAGIKRIRGEVLIDDRLFQKETGSGSGPQRVTPIIVNDNLIDLTIVPTTAGRAANVTWRPQTAYVRVDARVDTLPEGQPLTTSIRWTDSGGLILRGTIPAGHKPLVRVQEVPDAAGFARALFIEALRNAGIEVTASPLVSPTDAALPARDEYLRLKRVAQLVSPPFAENARLILKVSHNLHASALPLLLAASQGERTLAAGLKRQRDFLLRAGVSADTISFGGGAGGSAADFVTPRATVQLLLAMHKRPDADVFKRALPVLGVDGTLAEAVPADSPARGKFFAKTGTLYRDNVLNGTTLLTSKALAGYGTTRSGRLVAFAMFVNNVHLAQASETAKIGRTLGRLCELIYETD